jgi:predicted LPLAT superfamily acyltransferase
VHGGRCVTVDFLGHPAPFPQGPWLMAGLLRCPVNLISCLKVDGRYRIHLERFIEAPSWQRGQRDEAIRNWVQGYAERLARCCLEAPLQWFNFYPYWQTPNAETDDAH